MKNVIASFAFFALLCSCRGDKAEQAPNAGITAEMALEGVSNYCHSEYDWSIAKDDPDIMYVTMGEETDSTFQVVFRSYTGAFVRFYVDKASGMTRMEDYVPSLDITSPAGTIRLHDYLEKK